MLSQMFPSHTQPHFGIFIAREVESLTTYGKCNVTVFVPTAFTPGKFVSKKECSQFYQQYSATVEKLYYPPLPGAFFLPLKGLLFYLIARSRLNTIDFSFDILYAQRVYPEGYAWALLKRKTNTPLVIALRGADINELPSRSSLRSQIIWTLQQADLILALSSSQKERTVALGIGPEKIKIMPKGVNLDLFKPTQDKVSLRQQLNLPLTKTIVLSVGWLINRKNPFALIEVAKGMSKNYLKSILFVWVGSGPLLNRVLDEVQKQNLTEHFLFVGSVAPVDVAKWMAASDIFSLLSFSEGMPNVLYEAMATGLPIIASAVDGAKDILQDQETGFLVGPTDYNEIEKSLSTLVDDEKMRRMMGRNARSYIEKKNLDWSNNTKWLLENLQKIRFDGKN